MDHSHQLQSCWLGNPMLAGESSIITNIIDQIHQTKRGSGILKHPSVTIHQAAGRWEEDRDPQRSTEIHSGNDWGAPQLEFAGASPELRSGFKGRRIVSWLSLATKNHSKMMSWNILHFIHEIWHQDLASRHSSRVKVGSNLGLKPFCG